ncbi:MAG: GIY-YIG nuclease family protein [Dehalococcoidia bacterium]|nr:GIY-YIG nuclease family protein [Dehalococcoidia bacterium]
MSFNVYMLLCADASIYVGHTEDLEVRLAAHQSRYYSGYTARRLPVQLIFADSSSTRDEAFAAERQIKGWRRSKKLALARGDWQTVVELASVRAPDRGRPGG